MWPAVVWRGSMGPSCALWTRLVCLFYRGCSRYCAGRSRRCLYSAACCPCPELHSSSLIPRRPLRSLRLRYFACKQAPTRSIQHFWLF
ncbi:MAG: hypothetical protein J3K34DRAFT_407346 [Monoraphidium minutum]|nr:MAG: hypothetical protein J3K34DRAFT_407346 [Monoraphidium minutum]